MEKTKILIGPPGESKLVKPVEMAATGGRVGVGTREDGTPVVVLQFWDGETPMITVALPADLFRVMSADGLHFAADIERGRV